MPDFSSQINEARQNGHSDDDIIGYLSARPDLAPKIKEAKSSGYGSSDILGYLGKQTPAPNAPSPSHPYQPTWFDKITSGVTGDVGASQNPQDPIRQTIHGIGSSLGRTTQAWHDMLTGNAGTSTIPEMVPLIGPAAVDAGRMLATPGQGWQGIGATGALLAPAMAHAGALPDVAAMAERPITAAKGAMKGAWQGATEPIPISHGVMPRLLGLPEINLPASISRGIQGAGAGELLSHGKTGAVVGGAVGAVSPAIRGAIKGGKQALKDFDLQQYLDSVNRPPAARFEPSPTVLPDLTPIPSQGLPSGRMVGGIDNQVLTPPIPIRPPAARFEPSPTVLPDLTPILSETLPSGRRVGGIANQTASTPKSSPTVSDTAGIEPMDLEAAASLMSNGKKSFAEMTGPARTEAIKRASAFSANRTPAPTVATPITPVSTPAQSFVSPLEQQVTGGQPLTVPGAKLADLEGSLDTHLTARTAKIHNIHDYIATQTNLTPEAVEKLSPDEGLKLVKQASDWARGIGRTEGTLKNPKGKYTSFNMQETNPDTGATTTGTKAEVLNLLRGNSPSVNHPRPPQYGPAPITPIK